MSLVELAEFVTNLPTGRRATGPGSKGPSVGEMRWHFWSLTVAQNKHLMTIYR